MSTLLEQAMERVGALPDDEQDAIASQILDSLADEDAWKRRFLEKREVILRMAHEALEEDHRGETVSMDELLCLNRERRGNSGVDSRIYLVMCNGMRSVCSRTIPDLC